MAINDLAAAPTPTTIEVRRYRPMTITTNTVGGRRNRAVAQGRLLLGAGLLLEDPAIMMMDARVTTGCLNRVASPAARPPTTPTPATTAIGAFRFSSSLSLVDEKTVK